MTTKPAIILVHGAWADGSSWNDIILRLAHKGYPVTAAQLKLPVKVIVFNNGTLFPFLLPVIPLSAGVAILRIVLGATLLWTLARIAGHAEAARSALYYPHGIWLLYPGPPGPAPPAARPRSDHLRPSNPAGAGARSSAGRVPLCCSDRNPPLALSSFPATRRDRSLALAP